MLRSVFACLILVGLVSAASGKQQKSGPAIQMVDLSSGLTKEEVIFYRYCVAEFGRADANRMLGFILAMKRPSQGMMNGQINGMLQGMN